MVRVGGLVKSNPIVTEANYTRAKIFGSPNGCKSPLTYSDSTKENEHRPFSFGGKATLVHGVCWGYSGMDTKIKVNDITCRVPDGTACTVKIHVVHGNAAAACYDNGPESTHSYNLWNPAKLGDTAKVGDVAGPIGRIGCVIIEYSYSEPWTDG